MTTTLNRPPSTTEPLVTLDRLTKRYGRRTVVDGLSFEMAPGTITGFVGPNGAGKTTTIRMLLGLVKPDAGRGDVCGGDRSKVGALIDGPAFYPALSARRNLALVATLGGVGATQVDERLAQVGLTDRADDAVRTYSLGMRQRLGIAAALLTDPQVLFLDEPTNGLDPQGILDMRTLLRDQAMADKAILVSSHLLTEIEHLCDHLVIIADGAERFVGPIGHLEAQQRTELVLRAEDPGDIDTLISTLISAGHRVTPEPPDIRIVGSTGSPTEINPAEINRLAFDAGATLAELRTEREDLETTFLRLLSDGAA